MKSIALAFRNGLTTSLKGLHVLLLLGGMLSVSILFAASETVTFVLSRSQSAVTTNTLSQARIFRLTGIGARSLPRVKVLASFLKTAQRRAARSYSYTGALFWFQPAFCCSIGSGSAERMA